MLPEEIGDFNCLYSRVHKDFISSQDGLPRKTAFTNTPKEGDNLSCDWCKYSSPETSRELIGKQKKANGLYKNPNDFFIWRFFVDKVRAIDSPPQKVIHDPIDNNPEIDGLPNNIAHSIIIGQKPINNAEFRTRLLRAGEWARPL